MIISKAATCRNSPIADSSTTPYGSGNPLLSSSCVLLVLCRVVPSSNSIRNVESHFIEKHVIICHKYEICYVKRQPDPDGALRFRFNADFPPSLCLSLSSWLRSSDGGRGRRRLWRRRTAMRELTWQFFTLSHSAARRRPPFEGDLVDFSRSLLFHCHYFNFKGAMFSVYFFSPCWFSG